jgi:hypothetical protein
MRARACRYVQVPVQVVRQVEVVKEIPIEVVKEVERIKEVFRDVPVEVIREQVLRQCRLSLPPAAAPPLTARRGVGWGEGADHREGDPGAHAHRAGRRDSGRDDAVQGALFPPPPPGPPPGP